MKTLNPGKKLAQGISPKKFDYSYLDVLLKPYPDWFNDFTCYSYCSTADTTYARMYLRGTIRVNNTLLGYTPTRRLSFKTMDINSYSSEYIDSPFSTSTHFSLPK